MIEIREYAEKINHFFCEAFDGEILQYRIVVRLNFSLDVILYVEEPSQYTRDFLKSKYRDWCSGKCSELDIKSDEQMFWKNGNISFYVNPIEEYDGQVSTTDNLNQNSHIEWGPRYRLSTFFDKNSRYKEDTNTVPVVSFYSYKGGMGRTTTMMGFALWLAAKHNKKVGIIDCDLEAPGYLNFFNLSKIKDFENGKRNGFVEFASDLAFVRNPEKLDISRYVIKPVSPDNSQKIGELYDRIFIVPGGNLNEAFVREEDKEYDETEDNKYKIDTARQNRKDYIEGLSRLNLSNLSTLRNTFNTLIRKMYDEYQIDVVLIDSRTGFNDIYGSVAFNIADYVIAFFGFSKQTMPGLHQLLDTYYDINSSKAHTKKELGLTLVNSIIPTNNTGLWQSRQSEFKENISVYFKNRRNVTANEDILSTEEQVSSPEIFSLYRNGALEELGITDKAEKDFVEMILEDKNQDFDMLFDEVYENILENDSRMNDSMSFDRTISNRNSTEIKDCLNSKTTSLSQERTMILAKNVLRTVSSRLSKVKNFAESIDSFEQDTFLYRNCMKEIFDKNKFIIRGFKGAGKTCIYRVLGENDETREFVRACAKRDGADVPKNTTFINVISFTNISEHPLKVLEENGAFQKGEYYNISGLWQIILWNALFSDERYKNILPKDNGLKSYLFGNEVGNTALVKVDGLLKMGPSALAEIESHINILNQYLKEKEETLFVMYDGLDNVVSPKFWSKAVSPLINKWRGKIGYYSNINPKIFLRSDLYERIEGTNTERLRENIVDIDWTIEEVFGYLFKLVVSDNVAKQSLWEIYRRVSKKDGADKQIENYNKNIENNGGQLTCNDKNLKPLVRIFFGKEVNPGNSKLGNPWMYFKSQLSNAADKISLRPFINTLNNDVLSAAQADANPYVHEILPPKYYATREVRIKVAEAYFNDMASEEDFTDDLKYVKDFINSEAGSDFRYKNLTENEFTHFLSKIIEIYRGELKSVETPADLSRLLYASGLMREVYKPGHKIYKFATMYVYAWGLKSRNEIDEDDKSSRGRIKKDDSSIESFSGKINEAKDIILSRQNVF